MSLFSLIFGNKPKTAHLAKERLQLIIAHERDGGGSSANFLPDLQRELIAVISKYVKVNTDDIRVSLEKQGNYEVLEVNIVLPEKGYAPLPAPRKGTSIRAFCLLRTL